MPASFLDTNVLVYLASEDTAKAERAETLVAEGGAISVQVLNELANVARRKMRMTWPESRAFLSSLQALLEVHPLTVDTHAAGLALAERYGLSIYDSMIAAAALEAKCEVLWSEDMQHGLRIAGLSILNPFQAER
ncbi:MAG TPA: PIN domain-containing protein [Caulobacteraceae bacterium]